VEVPHSNHRLRTFLSASAAQSLSVEQVSPLPKAQEQQHRRVLVVHLLFQISQVSEDNSHLLRVHREHNPLLVVLVRRVPQDHLLLSAVDQLLLAQLPARSVLVSVQQRGLSRKHLKLPRHAHQ